MSYLNQTDRMGRWKFKKINKKNKASRTTSGKTKIYMPVPPMEGWPAFTGNYGVYGVRRGGK